MSSERPSYRAALRSQHVFRSFLPSILGRLSLATSGLALVLRLEQSTGSFAVSGVVTAVLGIANVLATPWRARLAVTPVVVATIHCLFMADEGFGFSHAVAGEDLSLCEEWRLRQADLFVVEVDGEPALLGGGDALRTDLVSCGAFSRWS